MSNFRESFEPVIFLTKLPLNKWVARYNGFSNGNFSGFNAKNGTFARNRTRRVKVT